MTRNPADFVQDMQMPAMKKKSGAPMDLMRPGNGTPWEDRGSSNAVSAYFKTVIKSFTSPALLVDHIRRTETTSDSSSFAIISAVMWMIGAVVYNVYWLYFVLPNDARYEPDLDSPILYWVTTGLCCAAVGGVIYLWLRMGPQMFRSLGANELKGAQPSLIGNCFNYAMGPSILAIIPFFGWALAVVWILFDVIAAGKRRLYMKNSGAVINVCLIALVVLAIAVLPWVFIHFVWGNILGMNGLAIKAAPKVIQSHRPE